jgi:hypothetical protein
MMENLQVAEHRKAEWRPEWLLPREDPREDASKIELYARAWVPGTRVEAYFGPVSSEMFLEDEDGPNRCAAWTEAQLEVLDLLCERARLKHANAVIGFEMVLDPFARCPRSGARGLYVYAVGTAAKLEPI